MLKDIWQKLWFHKLGITRIEDIWSLEGEKLRGLIPQNFIVYGELIGYTPDKGAIQAGYTYNLPLGECALYIYRVAFVNGDGLMTDLSWDGLKEFCAVRGLKPVPELFRGKHKDFKVAEYIDKRFCDAHTGVVHLGDNELVDEGVCIRVDKLTPYILKAKSPLFFEYETARIDAQDVDIEADSVIDAV